MTGIVLAGGEGRRMGADKAMLRLHGETFLERAVLRLQAVCREVVITIRPGQVVAEIPRCKIVADEKPGLGPLGGMVSGMGAVGDDWYLALACDVPLIRPEVLALLSREARGADAVVPHAGGKLQPLVAAYSRSCLEPAYSALRSGRRAIAAVLDQVRVKVIEERELRAVDPHLRSFLNVNTWQEYEAVRRWDTSGL